MRFAPLALVAIACQVDPGALPDAAPCRPSPDYFVSDVYPRYLQDGRCASDRGCHQTNGTLRLAPPEAAPAPSTPLDQWPTNWRNNYESTVPLVRCDNPLQSHLLTIPEGVGNLHPPGPVVTDRVAAADLIQSWVARSP